MLSYNTPFGIFIATLHLFDINLNEFVLLPRKYLNLSHALITFFQLDSAIDFSKY